MSGEEKSKKNKVVKAVVYFFVDVFSFALSWCIAMLLTGCSILACVENYVFWVSFICSCVVFIVMNAVLKLYSKILRYVDFYDALKIVLTVAVSSVCFAVSARVLEELTLNWLIVCCLIFTMMVFFTRFIFRIIGIIKNTARLSTEKRTGQRVMIVGAGDAGSILIREMKNSYKIDMYPVCVIDDDPYKFNQEISGVKVVGNVSNIVEKAKEFKIDEIILAMPSVNKKRIAEVLAECQKTNCKVRIIPGVYQMMQGNVKVSSVKDVEVNDLLGRDAVSVNLDEIATYIKNKSVLVTGGGGSIGSELCRQISKYKPKKLVIVDNYENNAYDIQQELKSRYHDLDLSVIIATVREKKRLEEIFSEFKPEIVFHAAAHKHVPLMEDSPNEAVKNNIGGTYNVAKTAGEYGVEKFVLISTDKAVNPTNIMGASKRVCELIIQSFSKKYSTDYVAVRFGNVLGSNGSVVPLFKKQIEEGGPVTVTDSRIVRYFMTIPEAVSLVLQAGAYAKGGEIFVLDMGNPVKIYDLAINMIKLSGLTPFEDIDVVITGLRPGEKLYEERLMDEEGLTETKNKMISICRPVKFDTEELIKKVEELINKAKSEPNDIINEIKSLVPTYKANK